MYSTSQVPSRIKNSLPPDMAVRVQKIGKMYRIYERPVDRLKQMLFARFGRSYGNEFWGLRNVSFTVPKGHSLGIIGRNGSGKSTLLQLIAGILVPNEGFVEVNGRVTALLELGSGFNPEFTGRENVYLNGSVLGIQRKAMDRYFDEISAFADIGQFMDQPVKLYSSGMFIRLAFAVQACVEPQILIVDEALSVGDVFFQQKCHERLEKLLAKKVAIILVSHDMGMIERYSQEVMVLDSGRCLFLGQPNEAVERYYRLEEKAILPKKETCSPPTRKSAESVAITEGQVNLDWPPKKDFLNLSKAAVIGDQEVAQCTGIVLCDEQGRPCSSFQIGDIACFYYEFQLLQDIEVPIGGVVITNSLNLNIHGKNSLQYFLQAPDRVSQGARVRFRQTIKLDVAPGDYSFMVGLATINALDYSQAALMNYEQLRRRIQEILRVRKAGRISVQWRIQGQSLPFHGYADLDGSCALSVLN